MLEGARAEQRPYARVTLLVCNTIVTVRGGKGLSLRIRGVGEEVMLVESKVGGEGGAEGRIRGSDLTDCWTPSRRSTNQ